MGELPTYLFPATQGFFEILIAIVWVIGFIRSRNFGFVLLALAALGASVTGLVRQAVFNYVVYHQSSVSVQERSSMVGAVASVFLIISVAFWLLTIIGAILVVFRRSRAEAPVESRPPVSG